MVVWGGTPLEKFKEPVCSFSGLSIKGTALVSRSKVIICLDLRPRFSSLLPHLGSTSWQPRRAWLALPARSVLILATHRSPALGGHQRPQANRTGVSEAYIPSPALKEEAGLQFPAQHLCGH